MPSSTWAAVPTSPKCMTASSPNGPRTWSTELACASSLTWWGTQATIGKMSSPSVLRPSRSIPIARASADDGSLPLSSTDRSSADERAGVEQHDVACRLAAWCCASPVRLRAVVSPETSKREAIGKQASHQSKKLSCCTTPNAAGMQPHTHTHTHTHTLCVCVRARDSRARASACVCV